MNEALYQRWKRASPPFDGQTVMFASEELTPLPALRQALLVIVPALQQRWSEAKLFMLDDWHEHDGYVSIARPTTWRELLERLGTNEETMAFTHGDWDVRLAFFPEDYGFYLRVYIPTEDDNDYPEQRGSFDVTCAVELASEIAGLAASASGLSVAESKAKAFFDLYFSG